MMISLSQYHYAQIMRLGSQSCFLTGSFILQQYQKKKSRAKTDKSVHVAVGYVLWIKCIKVMNDLLVSGYTKFAVDFDLFG